MFVRHSTGLSLGSLMGGAFVRRLQFYSHWPFVCFNFQTAFHSEEKHFGNAAPNTDFWNISLADWDKFLLSVDAAVDIVKSIVPLKSDFEVWTERMEV